MSPVGKRYFQLVTPYRQGRIVWKFVSIELSGNTFGYPYTYEEEWYNREYEALELFFEYPDWMTIPYIKNDYKYYKLTDRELESI